MCGIAGIFTYRPELPPVDPAELQAINDSMRARGPDGEGLWLEPQRRVGLAHRRLAIIDPSERAAQPMHSPDGRLVISFNGEIYNHRALREELSAGGARFRTSSDTEVLLALYASEGVGMFARLRGMFALALWDGEAGELVLARDSLGIKPLYVADDGATLRVASQVQALLAGGRVSRARDPAGLVGLCLWGSVPEPHTIYRSIRQLPAGCYMRIGQGGEPQTGRFFRLSDCLADVPNTPNTSNTSGTSGAPSQSPEERVRAALVDSVEHHLVSDVPVGAFLSAGIDSGALVGLMSRTADGPPSTVTVGFDEFRGQATDETPLAAQVARMYGAPHATRTVTRDEFETDLESVLAAMDQPSLDGINTWFVSKAMAELGIKVAVSGLGGDELFGGYPSFRDLPRWVETCRRPARVPGLGRALRRGMQPLLERTGWATPKLAGMLEYGGSFPGAYLLRRGVFMPWELDRLLPRDVIEQGLATLGPLEAARRALTPEPDSDFGRVWALETTLYMRNQLLRDTDWASMAHSLEVRVPLVDPVLWARVAPLLAHGDGLAAARARRAKQWLARSPQPPLPPSIVERPKTGFTTPIRPWLSRSQQLDAWRRIPSLCSPTTHWSRRLTYALLDRAIA